MYIEEYILGQQQPFFQRIADKAKGEIFPTVWYASNFEVTAAQQAIMSRSILIAENPFLKSVPVPSFDSLIYLAYINYADRSQPPDTTGAASKTKSAC